MLQTYSFLHLLGQIIFGGYFIHASYNHFKNHKALTDYSRAFKVPSPSLAVYVTGVMLLLGGLGVLFRFHFHTALWLLIAFLVPTTFMMHRYWEMTDPMHKMTNRINFYKNLGLIGALLMLM